jgi:thymidylate synthase ThyX
MAERLTTDPTTGHDLIDGSHRISWCSVCKAEEQELNQSRQQAELFERAESATDDAIVEAARKYNADVEVTAYDAAGDVLSRRVARPLWDQPEVLYGNGDTNYALSRELDHYDSGNQLLADVGFNNHSINDGSHTSPSDNAEIQVGVDGLKVRLLQGIDEDKLKDVLSRATKATTGLAYDSPADDRDWEEMMRGGLQAALESQVVVFEVFGASRALTHQLVRSRRAGFHQQSQRATFYGDYPEVRMPESIARNDRARTAFLRAAEAAAEAYRTAAEENISYQDARFSLLEGTTNYIVCEYPLREFFAVYSYRACSMFMWEMVVAMRAMGKALVEAHPMLAPYVKISCEKTGSVCHNCNGDGKLFKQSNSVVVRSGDIQDGGQRGTLIDCPDCNGAGRIGAKCTFQGWENVEGVCSLPWAKQDNRVFLPDPKFRIGK